MIETTLTYDAIAERLDAAEIPYDRIDTGTDREAIEIPGYGRLWYDRQPGVEPGWCVQAWTSQAGFDEHSEPIGPDEILQDLAELAEMREAIQGENED